MARPAQITSADISLRLQVNGALTAVELARALRVERSTISRGLGRLGREVLALGAARRARYALRRNVRSAGDGWPVYRIDANGRAREWARLNALHGGFHVEWPGEPPAWAGQAFDREGFIDGFPFFLGDLRPQGFLGRLDARRVAEALRLPMDPRQWGDDDTLVFLQAEGVDLPGDLIVGDGPLRQLLARQVDGAVVENGMAETERAAQYPELAARVAAGSWAGSSAGGEQPKFLTVVRERGGAVRPVLVKFSPPMALPAGRRWADLLAAEAQALAVLAEHGLATANARVLDAGGRRFLEVNRHDRVGVHGRRGVVSLEALHAALGGGPANDWPAAVSALARAGLIDAEAEAAVRRLHAFGELIGNVDMHFGNLSFRLDDTVPFRLAPAYDMLPMAWAPSVQGELIERAFAPRPPVPGESAAWSAAAEWASELWVRVVADETISSEFKESARGAGELVARMRAHFGGE